MNPSATEYQLPLAQINGLANRMTSKMSQPGSQSNSNLQQSGYREQSSSSMNQSSHLYNQSESVVLEGRNMVRRFNQSDLRLVRNSPMKFNPQRNTSHQLLTSSRDPSYKSISHIQNLPALQLKKRISIAEKVYQENISLYNKITNVRCHIPTRQQLQKENLVNKKIRERLSQYTHRVQAVEKPVGEGSIPQTIKVVKVERKKDPVEEREKMRINMQYLRRQLGSTVTQLTQSQTVQPISAEKHRNHIKLAPLEPSIVPQ